MLIQYDNFAENVDLQIKDIANFLNVKRSIYTSKILKKNNLPRIIGDNDREFKLNIIKKNINTKLFNNIIKLKKKYEQLKLFS